MHGDRVLAESRYSPDGRAEGDRAPATACPSTVVAIFHMAIATPYVTPLDREISQEIILPRA